MSEPLSQMQDLMQQKFSFPVLPSPSSSPSPSNPPSKTNLELSSPSTNCTSSAEKQQLISQNQLMMKFDQYMGGSEPKTGQKHTEENIEIMPVPLNFENNQDQQMQQTQEKVQEVQQQEERKKIRSPDKPINLQKQTAMNQDEEEADSYRSLSQKLQMALSRLKRTPTASSQFAARQQQFIRRKNSDINLLRVQKQKQDSLRYTNKPLLNSKSMQLLNNYQPIQYRYKDIIHQKNKKLNRSIALKKAKQDEQEERLVRDMQEHQQSIRNKFGKDVRTEEQYYAWMKTWNEVRDKKVQEMAYQQGKIQTQITSFKPHINQKSDYLMKKKPNRVPVYEQQPNTKKPKSDKNCTFKPNLNKTLANLQRGFKK